MRPDAEHHRHRRKATGISPAQLGPELREKERTAKFYGNSA